MYVKNVVLRNYLSYPDLSVEFVDGINVLTGQNAVGKTNLAESIYYASVGKSARGLKDKELLCWSGEGNAGLHLTVQKKYAKHTIDFDIDKQGKKRILIDKIPISKMGELMGAVYVVYFSPGEMRLIKESPADRRRFIDISLCQQDKVYFYTLVRYNQLLAQRNKLLKDHYDSPSLKQMSDIIVEKMCRDEEFIMNKRKAFLERLAPVAADRHKMLSGGKEDLILSYETEDVDENDIVGSLKKKYEESFEKDSRLSYTTVGIHRDDIKIVAGGIDVRKYGSQGQQRTAALSLKIAETELFYKTSGEYPVLILDDVMGELDEERQKALFESLKGIQTIVTCTSFDKAIAPDATVYEIKNRTIKKL